LCCQRAFDGILPLALIRLSRLLDLLDLPPRLSLLGRARKRCLLVLLRDLQVSLRRLGAQLKHAHGCGGHETSH
jgi:hypothetical protein